MKSPVVTGGWGSREATEQVPMMLGIAAWQRRAEAGREEDARYEKEDFSEVFSEKPLSHLPLHKMHEVVY